MRSIVPCSQSHCLGCPLELNQGKRLGTEINYEHSDETGTPNVDVLVVIDVATQSDDRSATIVGSKGGFELRMAIEKAGLDANVAYTTLMRCRPIKMDASPRDPTPEEVASCVNHLWQDIQQLRPKVVVTVGPIVTRALTKYPRWQKQSIHEIAGETWTNPLKGVKFFPIPNPYLWAFDKNPYKQRKRLTKLMSLLGEVVKGRETSMSSLGTTWYCNTLAEVKVALKRLRKHPFWLRGLDTETQNLNRVAENKLSCIQIAPDADMSYVIPLDHFDSPWTPDEREEVYKLLRDFFLDESVGFRCFVAHEAKFDLDKILRNFKIKRLAKPVVDPIFLEYLDDENMRASDDEDDNDSGGKFFSPFNLKALLLNNCNFRHYDSEVLDIRKDGKFWTMPMRVNAHTDNNQRLAKLFTDYCGMDGYGAVRLCLAQVARLESRGYTRAFNFAEKWGYRTTHLIRAMETNGLHIDREMLTFLQGPQSPIMARVNAIPDEIWETDEAKETNERLLKTDKRTASVPLLFGAKPRMFDISKKEHKVELLVTTCKLDPVETPRQLEGGKLPAIDKGFYAKHDYHPIVQLFQEHTGLAKLNSSYVNAIDKYLRDPDYPDNLFDGRMHAAFTNTRTLTGRLASQGPSVHQIPRGDNFAKACIKSLIAASPGHCLIEGDYAQAEVRWWAQLAGDMDFAQMFWNMLEIQETYYKNPTKENKIRKELECDVHRQVAALMFGLDIADVSKHQRQAAKNITFGSIYGQSAKALAVVLKISEQEAVDLQNKFIGRFKQAGPWLMWIEEEAKRLGYVEAPNGRRRHLGDLFDFDEGGTRRQARNSPIQAIASDVMAEAAFLQQCWVEDRGYDDTKAVRLVNLIHDALLQEVKLDFELIREVIQSTTKHMMQDVETVMLRDYGCKMIVPMVADFKLGLRWGHAHEWDRGEDLAHMFDDMMRQDSAIASGTPFWHYAVGDEIKTAAKDEKKLLEEIVKAQGKSDFKEKVKLDTKLARLRKHQTYLQTLPVAA